MLGQYKKIAMGEFNRLQQWDMYSEFKIKIPIDFKMSRCIIRGVVESEINVNDSTFLMDTKNVDKVPRTFGNCSREYAWYGDFNLVNNEVAVRVLDSRTGKMKLKLLDWIAME